MEVVGKDEARVKGSCEGLLKAVASATGNRAIMMASVGGLNWAGAGQDSLEDAYTFSVPV